MTEITTTTTTTTVTTTTEQWRTVDEGWGRGAVDFATLLEPAACREYVALHEQLRLRRGESLLDVACGSGLALELAAIHGVTGAGIDASSRLVAAARDRVPAADIRVGDMAALPWADASFDVVTSFRGLWATTLPALAEARRVLRPGGRIGLTTWGHVKASPGVWALTPFSLAAPEKVRAQAEMKSLGRPGVGEQVLLDAGFVDVRRHAIPFVWEFADPEHFARALAATGPAHEAISQVGEDEFRRFCLEVATARVRDGRPLRAEIDCVGLTARAAAPPRRLLLDEAASTATVDAMAREDREELGFVARATRVWMHAPESCDALFDAFGSAARGAGLSFVERAVATVVGASAAGDTYCPLAWGDKLARATSPGLAAAVLSGSYDDLDERGRAVADWARSVASAPTATSSDQLEWLHAVGFGDAEILELSLFVALRVAFSTVNQALGAEPEPAYVEHVHDDVRRAWRETLG